MAVGHTGVTGGGTGALAPCGSPDHPDCGIRDMLDRLGDRWSVLVLAELSPGVRRFSQLQRGLPGISQRMLTLTLRRLERDGLVSRTVYPTVPATVTYELTGRGSGLTVLIRQLVAWSAAHRDAIAESRRRWDEGDPGAAPDMPPANPPYQPRPATRTDRG